MSLSNYTENAILNWFKGTTFPAAPGNIYVGLFNGDPGEAGSGGSEVTTTIRAAGRPSVTFGAISGGAISNSGIVDFGAAAGGASATHFALFDAASAGNLLASAALDNIRTVATGNAVTFEAGALDLIVD